ncbi:DNA mismatch repair protein MutS [Clostridium sp. CCUG 7971]|uniref:MutS-related protein n=1 Tax=Clostridium sp. CCUG 7971 TaxID=2811414 RepID=UPI001ABB5589|nr:DNA mismatch repair protein MutS [Clostridium sp. CCUG 7971]MBO3444942.1 DNA mismatch repair protein MutS [Clostridium sp. CCUG 7971]
MRDIVNFLLGMGFIFLIGVSFSLFDYMNKMKFIKESILNNYGKEIDLEDVKYKMVSVSSYFENKKINNCIDDITWNDLSMDDIYKKINNTQSSAGRDVLYTMLRCPLYDKEALSKRDKVIDYFRNDEEKRREIQYTLGKLGESKELYTTNCLFNEMDNSKSKLLRYKILSYIPWISILLSLLNGYFLILLIASIGVNIWISYNDKQYNYNIDGFTYIISVVRAASKIKELNIVDIDDNLDDISASLEKVRKIRNKSIDGSSQIINSDVNVLSEYINMITLKELKNYEKVKNTVIKNSKEFKEIYDYVGTVDALIGVASFRDSLDYYSKPNLKKSNCREENKIEFVDIYHPLIKNPIANSGMFNKSVLLTGSNASGKSTFIKTVAINAILSQTIFTSCAREYSSSFFNIYTSMALKDDIFSSESYYIVEIKSLKRIIDSVNDDIPCLCFVDEILRGTNTVERIASSAEVLSHLEKNNTVCFAATHDIELTHLLEDKFENYHFEETITDNDIEFDYKLHKGRAQTRNAIKLLGFMEYDKDIVQKADNRAKAFLETGKW